MQPTNKLEKCEHSKKYAYIWLLFELSGIRWKIMVVDRQSGGNDSHFCTVYTRLIHMKSVYTTQLFE